MCRHLKVKLWIYSVKWNGPKWLVSISISIQSLFCNNPVIVLGF